MFILLLMMLTNESQGNIRKRKSIEFLQFGNSVAANRQDGRLQLVFVDPYFYVLW